MAILTYKMQFPGDPSWQNGIDPPNIVTNEKRYPSDGDALDRAKTLLWEDKQRQLKDPKQLPALTWLQIELDDGRIMNDVNVRRVAPQIRD